MEMSPPKSCAVCGDKALGYNFNAVTCESCKAFFRRNALAKKQFTCPFSQNCEITVVTRRFCQRCRLKKCLDIGMKSENIMSEEDKLIKRRKIECNRAKRRLNENKIGSLADSTGFDTTSHDSQSSFDSGKGTASNNSGSAAITNLPSPIGGTAPIRSPILLESDNDMKPELMTSDEMVEFIVGDPDRASQAISKLMRTKDEALSIVEKILSSQKDSLRLVSHLIAFPGDALKIISKIMNSPFDALTVFTKFMSSPTDALEIISKIVSSPQDVVQFIRNLMECPEDALDIMNKFMNTPAEALRIINKIFNTLNPPTRSDELHKLLLDATKDNKETSFQSIQTHSESKGSDSGHHLLQSMLENSPVMTHDIANKLSPSNQQSISVNSDIMVESPINIQEMSIRTDTPDQTLSSIQSESIQSTPPSMSTSVLSPSQTMQIGSPECSVIAQDLQYNSPTSLHADIVLPSTSAGLINPNSPTDITSESADFSNEHFDIKTFIQNSFPENASGGDSLNSLESVLSEVIRIEFQAFNNLPPEPRVKQEQFQYQSNHMTVHNSVQQQQCGYSVYNTQPQQNICSPSGEMMRRDLNEAEQMKLRELKMASEALYYPMDNDLSLLMMGDDRIKPEETHQDPKLLQVINLTAVAIKRLIKMAKKISVFRNMCQEDQVALLKGGCTEMMLMRSVLTYDNNRNTWKLPHVSNAAHLRAEILRAAKGNIYEEILKFVSTFDEKWRLDENIILILCAIVLFTPTRACVIHSDVIRLEQNSYYYLLRRYLESIYSGCEAKSAFIKLIQKISDIERLNQFVIGVYLNVNPSQVEPLLREIFDLKNH
ncbi:nuclear hormone receptor HR96 [Anastrepha ludens]|uniref:nuclear hormone receptor HR96 n=1 Tax=Anastrepha ludens TaxID=28586 RepID=UPI0023AE7E37|nr:nuclear hormone receptor HR96 [Anastrepha ludens]XP_053946975.1 nuclear hormone receptor HR96 [Anastrepha ludens]